MSTSNRDMADLCEAAAIYIEQHGWTRHNYRNHGRVCLVGAINAVAEQTLADYSKAFDTRYFIRDHMLDGEAVTAWNDAQKTRAPVIALLRETAAVLRPSA